MSILELTKDVPTKESSSERTGIFSSLFSGNRGAGSESELERIDRLAMEAESALDKQESSMLERHKAARALLRAVIGSKAFNFGLVSAVKELLAGDNEKRARDKSKLEASIKKDYVNIALLVVSFFLAGLELLGTPVGLVIAIVLIYVALLNNSKKITISRVLWYLVISVTHGSIVVPILASSWNITRIGILILVILSGVFWLWLVLPLRGNSKDSVSVVTKREPKQCLIDKGASDYALSVIKRCFDAGVISDSSFSAEAEDTVSGDEVYKRVPERVRVSALLAILHGDKESISLKALLRKTDRGERA